MSLPAKKEKPSVGRLLFKYFFQGLFLLAPIILTFYIVFGLLRFLLSFIEKLIPLPDFITINGFPIIELLLVLGVITFAGYLSTTYIFKPLFVYLERLILRIPLAKIIYTALKDLFAAFVTDKRKFEKPVLVILSKSAGIKKMGFITEEDIDLISAPGDVAVYFPHSYNFSGNLYIVPKDNVTVLDISSTDAMKFIVSGGVTEFTEDTKMMLPDDVVIDEAIKQESRSQEAKTEESESRGTEEPENGKKDKT